MASDLVAVENRLWATADQLWANTGLKPSEFSTPVLGLIFLRYADKRFSDCALILNAKGVPPDEREPMDYQAEGVLYLRDAARFGNLLTLTEGANLGKAIATAMSLVEEHNPELKGVLPRGYNLLPNATLVELLRLLASVDLDGDAFGKVYEYFLGILPAQAALSTGYQEASRLATGGDEQVVPTSAAMREADELLTALPQWCVAPVPTVEPSGAIAFEWDQGPSRWLVLALKGTGTIEHSAILGLGYEMHGTRNFAGRLGRHEIALLSELM